MTAISSTIPQTYVDQFSSNVFHLSQQKDSRLLPFVRMEQVSSAQRAFFDRIGETEMIEKVGRASQTQFQDVEWSRRRVTYRDWVWAHPVDQEEKLRLMHSPESELALAARQAAGRKQDEIIIGSALGQSFAGRDGSVAVSLGNDQKIGATDGSAFSKLTVETLRLIREKFWENEAVMSEDETIELACTSRDIMNLLREEEITSADFNNVRALVNGEIDTFMGFRFHRLELLPQLAASLSFDPADGSVGSGSGSLPIGANRCFAWVRDGVMMSLPQDIMGRVDERGDLNYATQVYLKFSMGGTRMEEKKVVEVITKQ